MSVVWGDLTVKIIRGVNLQNLKVFGTCNPYVIAKLRSSTDSFTTSVKDGQANPSWQDTFTFRNVASSDELQISLMEKDRAREGVVSVGPYLASTEWGFPGAEERVIEVAMPPAGRSTVSPSLGTVIVSLRYRAQVQFRSPLGLLAMAVAKTGLLTEKTNVDNVLDKALDLIVAPVKLAERATGSMTKTQKYASGGAAAVVAGGASMGLMALAVPVCFMALLFLPLTLMGGFFLAAMAIMLLPFVLVLGWVVLCSRPIQCRVWMPSLFWVMNKAPYVANVLLQPASAGAQQ